MNEDDQTMFIPQGLPSGMMRGDRADLIEKIKPEQVVEIIRQKLLGNDLIDGIWKPNPALKSRSLSEVGAWELSNLMVGTASLNTSISKLQDFEIKRRILSIATTAQKMCVQNFHAYNITSTSQLNFVHEIIFTNGLMVLKQAHNASIQNLLMGTMTETRLVHNEIKKPGIIKRIFGGGNQQ